MPENEIEIITKPRDLFRRMNKYPDELRRRMGQTLNKSLDHIQGKVPSYPPRPPESTYQRTGTLGRTLTKAQPPGFREVKRLGPAKWEARLGTRLEYAVRVIGDPPGKSQASHMGHWWTIKVVAKRARRGVIKLFEQMTEGLARFLEGQG